MCYNLQQTGLWSFEVKCFAVTAVKGVKLSPFDHEITESHLIFYECYFQLFSFSPFFWSVLKASFFLKNPAAVQGGFWE